MHKILSVICPTVTELMAKKRGIKFPIIFKKKKNKRHKQVAGQIALAGLTEREPATLSRHDLNHSTPSQSISEKTGLEVTGGVTLGTAAFHPTATYNRHHENHSKTGRCQEEKSLPAVGTGLGRRLRLTIWEQDDWERRQSSPHSHK